MENTRKYHISLRIIHWLTAILILLMIFMGWYMTDIVSKDNHELRDKIVIVHKSIGILIILLFFIRVGFRLFTKIPPLPEGISFIERIMANAGHALLYIFIFIVPVSGYAMSNFYGYGVKFFGIETPRLLPANRQWGAYAKELHEILPYLLLGLVCLHIAAVIKHKFFDKPGNDVLRRMI